MSILDILQHAEIGRRSNCFGTGSPTPNRMIVGQCESHGLSLSQLGGRLLPAAVLGTTITHKSTPHCTVSGSNYGSLGRDAITAQISPTPTNILQQWRLHSTYRLNTLPWQFSLCFYDNHCHTTTNQLYSIMVLICVLLIVLARQTPDVCTAVCQLYYPPYKAQIALRLH